MGSRKYAGEYTRVYKDLRGVDMCGDGAEISKNRLAACVNMYKDYEAEGAPVIESIPGYRRLFSLGEPINALFCHSGAIGEVILAPVLAFYLPALHFIAFGYQFNGFNAITVVK